MGSIIFSNIYTNRTYQARLSQIIRNSKTGESNETLELDGI